MGKWKVLKAKIKIRLVHVGEGGAYYLPRTGANPMSITQKRADCLASLDSY